MKKIFLKNKILSLTTSIFIASGLNVDNLFDKTYASTNTYQDVTYIAVDTVDTLLNDPGRYMYVNVKYSF
ncbi:MAG: Uncharacterised protein [Arcobacter lacus]|nr:MAG: Uncharacterised protein [Arcobacter lacus]